jgi:hypothetical protein
VKFARSMRIQVGHPTAGTSQPPDTLLLFNP